MAYFGRDFRVKVTGNLDGGNFKEMHTTSHQYDQWRELIGAGRKGIQDHAKNNKEHGLSGAVLNPNFQHPPENILPGDQEMFTLYLFPFASGHHP